VSYDPYTAPRAPVGAQIIPGDATDVYIETLPSPMVRAAGAVAVLTGIAMFFSVLRFVLSGVEGPGAVIVEGVLVGLGVVEIAVAWGITGARGAWMFGMSLAVLQGVLLGVGFPKIRRMAQARAQMRTMG
jgi:hypothetical protein